MKKIPLSPLLFSVWLLFCVVKSAHAYIDPGTGSFLFQLVMAGILGSLFFIKTIIRSIKHSLAKLFGGGKADLDTTQEKNED